MQLTNLRIAAIAVFAIGILVLAAGIVATVGGSDDIPADPDDTPAATATATQTPSAQPTTTGTPEPPTPTPTPFAGGVARFQLEAFGVDSAVEPIGVDTNNQLETPRDPHDTGWYYIYDRPGWGGNAVFSAHVDYWPDIRGPFYNLADSDEGDRFHVVMENGARYVYEFLRYQQYPVDTIPMGELIAAPDRPEGEEWITLITCGGELERPCEDCPGAYLHRDVVIARLIERHPV